MTLEVFAFISCQTFLGTRKASIFLPLNVLFFEICRKGRGQVSQDSSDLVETILIFGRSETTVAPVEQVRRLRSELQQPTNSTVEAKDIALEKLRTNFNNTMLQLRSLFAGALEQSVGDIGLDSIELNLEVTAEGKVGLLGMGATVTGTSGLKLTFKRTLSKKEQIPNSLE